MNIIKNYYKIDFMKIEAFIKKTYEITFDIFNKLIYIVEKIFPILEKIIMILFRYFLISSITIAITGASVFIISPSLFKYMLIYLNIDTFKNLENLVENPRVYIDELKELRKQYEETKLQLGEANGERDGLLKALNNIEKTNWKNVMITIGGITFIIAMIVGVFYYQSDNTGEIGKLITKTISDGTKNNNKMITKTTDVIIESIANVNFNIRITYRKVNRD